MKKQEMEEQFNRPSKNGGSQPRQQGSPTRMQVAWIASTRQEESLWASPGCWQREGTVSSIPGRQICRSMGECWRRYLVFAVFLGT